MNTQQDIVEELRQLHEYERRHNPPPNRIWAKAAALIEALQRQNDIARGCLASIGKCQASVNGHLARVGLAAMDEAIATGAYRQGEAK